MDQSAVSTAEHADQDGIEMTLLRLDRFRLQAKLTPRTGHEKGGIGYNKNETIGNIVRCNPDRFGKNVQLIETVTVGHGEKFFRAYLRTDSGIRSDDKRGHSSRDAAIGSLVRVRPDLFGIKSIDTSHI